MDRATAEAFHEASPYRDPVDRKKLDFILAALERQAQDKGVTLRDLRILEVGCGRGGITLPLATLGCTVRALDQDAGELAHLESQLTRAGSRNVVVSRDNALTFDDGVAYDVVVASEVFEHVLDPAALCANLVRRMGPGAHLIVTTPNGYGPWEIKNRLSPIQALQRWNLLRRLMGKPVYRKGTGIDHCQFYTRQRLLSIFAVESLQLVASGNSDSFLALVPGLRRSPALGRLDIRMADVLPDWCASGWYLVFKKAR